MHTVQEVMDALAKCKKNSPVLGWGGLSKKSNIKMSKECPKLAVMHNMSINKKVKQMDYGCKS